MKVMSLSSEEIASRLMLSVINYKENEDKLSSYPFIKKGNFALLAQICIGMKNENGLYPACLTVTNEMFDKWGMSKNILFEAAMNNSKNLFPASCQPLEHYMNKKYTGIELLTGSVDLANTFILTNKQHFNGAAALFYSPELLEVMTARCNTENIILAPSSVNQIYCMPVKNGDDLREARELFKNFLNAFSEEERFAENVLIYDGKTKTITESDGQIFSLNLNEDVTRKHDYAR